MAENENKKSDVVQSSLGRLFIDIGANGLGNLVKGLNGLSAQFLLTKNAAQQAIKPLVNMSQNAASQITNYDRLHSIMGTQIQDLQDLKIAAQEVGIKPELVFSQMQAVQQQITKIKTGFDANGLQGLSILGIQPFELDQKDPMGIIMKVGEKLRTANAETRTMVLGLLGWSEDLAYMFDRMSVALDKQNSKFNQNLKLTDKEIDDLRELQDSWNLLGVTWELAQQKFIANQKTINKLLENTIDWLAGEHPILEGILNNIDKSLAALGKGWAIINLLKRGVFLPSINSETMTAARHMTPEQIERYNKIKAQQESALNNQKGQVLNNLKAPKDVAQTKAENTLKSTASIATPLNEESMVIPDLPKFAAPDNPTEYLSSGTQKNISFEIIENNQLNIQIPSDRPEEVAEALSNYITNNTLTAISNRQLSDI